MPVAGHPYILPAAAAQNRALRIHRLLAIGDLPQRLQAFGHRGGIILDGIGHFLGSVGDFDGPAEIRKAEKDAAVLFPLFIRGQLYLQTIVNGMPIYAAGNRKRHVHFAAGALIPFPAFPGRNAGWIGNGDAVKGIILNQRCIAPLSGGGKIGCASGHVSGHIEQQNAVAEAQRNAPLAFRAYRRSIRPDQAGVVNIRMGKNTLSCIAGGRKAELAVDFFQRIRGDIVSRLAAEFRLLADLLHGDQLPLIVDQHIAFHAGGIRGGSRFIRSSPSRAAQRQYAENE